MLFLPPGMPFPVSIIACTARIHHNASFQCSLFWEAFLMPQALATSLLRAPGHTSMKACHSLFPTRLRAFKGRLISLLNTVTMRDT